MVQTAWGVSIITEGGWLHVCTSATDDLTLQGGFRGVTAVVMSLRCLAQLDKVILFLILFHNVILEADVSLCCLPAQSEQTDTSLGYSLSRPAAVS